MARHITVLCALMLAAGLVTAGCGPADSEANSTAPAGPVDAGDVSADVSAPPEDCGPEGEFSVTGGPRLEGEQKPCPKCGGQGYTACIRCNGRGKETCGFCWGSGSVEVACRTCNGSGRVQTEICGTCNGARTVTEQCDNCDGTGGILCGRCAGQGVETCTICAGTGVNPLQ